jgi:hypothetical protein
MFIFEVRGHFEGITRLQRNISPLTQFAHNKEWKIRFNVFFNLPIQRFWTLQRSLAPMYNISSMLSISYLDLRCRQFRGTGGVSVVLLPLPGLVRPVHLRDLGASDDGDRGQRGRRRWRRQIWIRRWRPPYSRDGVRGRRHDLAERPLVVVVVRLLLLVVVVVWMGMMLYFCCFLRDSHRHDD